MTFEIFPSLEHISQNFNGILLDAYGVFWGGNDFGILPGSKEAMEKLISNGKVVGILSNSTQLAAKEINKLERHGLIQGKHFHFLITSGEIARATFLNKKLLFETPRNTFWLFGGIHPKFSSHEAIFQGTSFRETPNISDADFIYVSVPHINGEDQVDAELFREEIQKIKFKNLPMVCPNPDLYAHEGKPPKAVVRQGSIAKMYEELGGKVFYIGKPHNMAYTFALEQFRQHRVMTSAEILMVGDTPETDIRGAKQFGMSSAMVTKTGIMAERISHKGLDHALRALPANDTPTYLIERLCQEFALHPNLEKKTFVVDLPLCRVLLEDNQHYPWLFLVPRRQHISRMMDLSDCDQLQLLKELNFTQRLMWDEFKPTQLNVAAIGNKTPQLHIHVIARYENDPAWPNTVWDHPKRSPYSEESKASMLLKLKHLFTLI